jgi:hypothetical protein
MIMAATIKTDLAAIRFFHDKMSNPQHTLPDNSTLNLSRRKFIGYNRAWTDAEFTAMCDLSGGGNDE